jgi:replicative DNA helicase
MFKSNQLIIIGGVSSVGKSTLLKKILEGEHSDLSDQLGIDHNFPPYIFSMKEKAAQTHINNVIIDFDTTSHNLSLHGCWPNLAELIQQASHVTVVTLCASSTELHSRMSLRIKKARHKFLLKPRIMSIMRFFRQRRKLCMYKDNYKLINIYEQWSTFIEEHAPATHWLIDSTKTISTAAVPYEQAKVKKILNEGQTSQP